MNLLYSVINPKQNEPLQSLIKVSCSHFTSAVLAYYFIALSNIQCPSKISEWIHPILFFSNLFCCYSKNLRYCVVIGTIIPNGCVGLLRAELASDSVNTSEETFIKDCNLNICENYEELPRQKKATGRKKKAPPAKKKAKKRWGGGWGWGRRRRYWWYYV